MFHVLFAFAALPIFSQAAPLPTAPEATPEDAHVLHLNEALERALKNQPTLRQARAQTAVADAKTGVSEAGLFPQINLLASYQRVRTAAIGSRTSAAGASTPVVTTNDSGIDVFSFGGNATLLLWDFGQTYNQYRAAKRLTTSLEASEKTAEQTVVAGVRRSYFTARAQKDLVSVAEENLRNLQLHLEQIRGMVTVGTRPEIDLAQAKTDLANGRVQLIQAQNAYAVAKAQLTSAMGSIEDGPFEVADDELPQVAGEDSTADRLLEGAIRNRPELVALERQRESQELSVKAARGAYGPSLTASAGASKTGTDLGSLGTAWNVGAQLTWPIFQGGLTRSQVRLAEANMNATDAQFDAQKLQIRLDIEQALVTLRAAKATTAATQEALENAREQLKLAEGRYSAGVGTAIELGDAQVSVTTAAANVVQAKFNVSAARADLLTALGLK